MRSELFKLAAEKREGATMTHLFEWSKFDYDNERDVDDFINKHFDEIKQRSSPSRPPLFPGLLTDSDAK